MFIWTVLLLAGAVARAQEQADDALAGLLRQAYAQSPELRAAQARWQAALERVPQAEALPDPRVSYGYFVERMDTRQRFRVEQMFPAFGTRRLRGDVMAAEAQVAAEALEAVAAAVRARVLGAVADWVLAGQSAALVQNNLGLVRELEAVALQRYRAGGVPQADVLRLQMEADALETELLGWHEREAPLRARVNALLGRPAATLLPRIDALPHPEPPALDSGEFSRRLAGHPTVRKELSMIRAAEKARTLAGRASRPELMLGVEFMDNTGMARDEVMAMVSINLPVWRDRYRAQRREAAASLLAAEQEYAARLNEIEADARMALYELQDAHRQVRLFEDSLLPRARQTLELLEAGYRTGAAAFLDLQEGRRTLLELELGLARARADTFARQAEWERLISPHEYQPH